MVLLKHAKDILDVKIEQYQDAWEAWAEAVGLSCFWWPYHTAVLAGLIRLEPGAHCKRMAGLLREKDSASL